jgi:hypothetical protein
LCIDDNNFVDSEGNLFHTLKWLTNDNDKRATDNKSIAASGLDVGAIGVNGKKCVASPCF